MISLEQVAQLPQRFNELAKASRVLMVLSPTCGDCLAGARIVAAEVAKGVLVVWTDMRPSDSAAAAVQAGTELPTHFHHFWEVEPWPVSTALRPLLGLGPYDASRSAWDVYLFYPSGANWVGSVTTPPTPAAWAYNLVEDPGVGVRLDAKVVRGWFA